MANSNHPGNELRRGEAEFRRRHVESIIPRNFRRPSEEFDDYWITSKDDKQAFNGEIGKWLLFGPKSHMDSDWFIISKETENGMLGPSSKISTMRDNPNSSDPTQFVICVYTTDEYKEQTRVLSTLRYFGWKLDLCYKTDASTRAGQYSNRGNRRISSRIDRGEDREWWTEEEITREYSERIRSILFH